MSAAIADLIMEAAMFSDLSPEVLALFEIAVLAASCHADPQFGLDQIEKVARAAIAKVPT